MSCWHTGTTGECQICKADKENSLLRSQLHDVTGRSMSRKHKLHKARQTIANLDAQQQDAESRIKEIVAENTRLKAQVAEWEQDHAKAMALVLSHESRIAKQEQTIADLCVALEALLNCPLEGCFHGKNCRSEPCTCGLAEARAAQATGRAALAAARGEKP